MIADRTVLEQSLIKNSSYFPHSELILSIRSLSSFFTELAEGTKGQRGRRKSRLFLFIVTAVILLFTACGKTPERGNEPRYIVTSPEVAEILYLLDPEINIVGITEEISFPVHWQEISKVGNFGAISIEKIIALQPTLVFTSGLEQDKLSADLEKMRIQAVRIYPRSIAEMLEGVKLIGETIGNPARGEQAADSIRVELEKIRYGKEDKPSIYFEIYGNPVMSVSDNSLIGEIIALAGGRNIFPELPRDYSRIRQEEVINANPDIIILTYPGVSKEQVKNRKGWKNINACINNRIYDTNDINPDLILRAGPRIIEGVRILQEILHGE